MKRRTRLVLIGVDGLDLDVVFRLGRDRLPHLFPLVTGGRPHASTFPPDSLSSWTSIFTGVAPGAHGRFWSKNYILDPTDASGQEQVKLPARPFWADLPEARNAAVINPFLLYLPSVARANDAVVSGPSFSEGVSAVADPVERLVGLLPERLGGFTEIPTRAGMQAFAEKTEAIAAAQYRYALHQVECGRFDVVFHTSLTIDRIQHFAWRFFDEIDPYHEPGPLSELVPRAHEPLDGFIAVLQAAMPSGAETVVFCDHGHGPRAPIGVNLDELFRREGLLELTPPPLSHRVVESAKTFTLSNAMQTGLEDLVLKAARKMPRKAELQSGALAGDRSEAALRVTTLGSSNPLGAIDTGGDAGLALRCTEVLRSLDYRGTKVVRRVEPPEAWHDGPTQCYPDLLFELQPQFGPTWNFYGALFAPIVTRKRLSGGHTRRGVFGASTGLAAPRDSTGVGQILRRTMASV